MTDTFRKEYKPLTDSQKAAMDEIKTIAGQLEEKLNEISDPNNGREISLAKTNLEQSIMWAVKGITK